VTTAEVIADRAMGDGSVRIGTSGYSYDHWRGVLYGSGLPRDRWLQRYAECFDTVELNGTFYGLPARDAVRRWQQQVPADFLFAAKMSRYGTHLKRLREPSGWLDRFFDAMEPLGSRLGPILIQLPPRWRRDLGRLTDLLDVLPGGRRFAMEFRDPDWLHESVFDALRAHDVALCIHDLVEDHPNVVTAGWVYLRFHGPSRARPYTGRYPTQTLTDVARRTQRHAEAGLDVYAYFDNDGGGAAVKDALRLRSYLVGDTPQDRAAGTQAESPEP
jgi:uncharacterized protein YecE (DUF72 family)